MGRMVKTKNSFTVLHTVCIIQCSLQIQDAPSFEGGQTVFKVHHHHNLIKFRVGRCLGQPYLETDEGRAFKSVARQWFALSISFILTPLLLPTVLTAKHFFAAILLMKRIILCTKLRRRLKTRTMTYTHLHIHKKTYTRTLPPDYVHPMQQHLRSSKTC